MHDKTVRGALRGATATIAVCAALTGGAAAASAAPLPLEPATDATTTTVDGNAKPVTDLLTTSGSSSLSSSINAKVTCLLQRTLSAQGKWDCN
ncbi:hypothetical protein [Nocardia arthritidis]|uniref:Uncharacterized protein n=1 Tax=Nocardia arthritidis TaxID=228602 RepID=A0A6G9YNS3_9NOCA|nr:hypothetical protein [Nocardia arthritidis]QIS14676.1 hypothetical protein F5544_34205 [Nocardia arthritidis]